MTDTPCDSNGMPAHQAVEASDYETLTVLLASGTDQDERCFGHTPLTHALDLEGDGHAMAQELLKRCIPPREGL